MRCRLILLTAVTDPLAIRYTVLLFHTFASTAKGRDDNKPQFPRRKCWKFNDKLGGGGGGGTYDEPVASGLLKNVLPTEKCDSPHTHYHPSGLLPCLQMKAVLSCASK